MIKETIGNAVLYQGDCLEVMAQFENKELDAVVTDPPYGVELSYKSYIDSLENFINLIVPRIERALKCCNTGAIFAGNSNLLYLPKNGVAGGLFLPASTGLNRWGFTNIAHCIFYGKRLYKGCLPTSINLKDNKRENYDHTCVKPVSWMKWALKMVADYKKPINLILDPFMGSGTTGVACHNLGHRFIGVEQDAEYFDIACKRIEQAQRQANLFEPEQLVAT